MTKKHKFKIPINHLKNLIIANQRKGAKYFRIIQVWVNQERYTKRRSMIVRIIVVIVRRENTVIHVQ